MENRNKLSIPSSVGEHKGKEFEVLGEAAFREGWQIGKTEPWNGRQHNSVIFFFEHASREMVDLHRGRAASALTCTTRVSCLLLVSDRRNCD